MKKMYPEVLKVISFIVSLFVTKWTFDVVTSGQPIGDALYHSSSFYDLILFRSYMHWQDSAPVFGGAKIPGVMIEKVDVVPGIFIWIFIVVLAFLIYLLLRLFAPKN